MDVRINNFADALTRKCDCGGTPEMFMDFVQDYFVRCKICHKSTKACYPADAAVTAWQNKELMTQPLSIFSDDYEGNLSGRITEILFEIDDEAMWINSREYRFCECILHYENKLITIKNYDGCLDISEISRFNEEAYEQYSAFPLNYDTCNISRIEYIKRHYPKTIEITDGKLKLLLTAESGENGLLRMRFPKFRIHNN